MQPKYRSRKNEKCLFWGCYPKNDSKVFRTKEKSSNLFPDKDKHVYRIRCHSLSNSYNQKIEATRILEWFGHCVVYSSYIRILIAPLLSSNSSLYSNWLYDKLKKKIWLSQLTLKMTCNLHEIHLHFRFNWGLQLIEVCHVLLTFIQLEVGFLKYYDIVKAKLNESW